jgi:hypothetical protein
MVSGVGSGSCILCAKTRHGHQSISTMSSHDLRHRQATNAVRAIPERLHNSYSCQDLLKTLESMQQKYLERERKARLSKAAWSCKLSHSQGNTGDLTFGTPLKECGVSEMADHARPTCPADLACPSHPRGRARGTSQGRPSSAAGLRWRRSRRRPRPRARQWPHPSCCRAVLAASAGLCADGESDPHSGFTGVPLRVHWSSQGPASADRLLDPLADHTFRLPMGCALASAHSPVCSSELMIGGWGMCGESGAHRATRRAGSGGWAGR